MKLTKREQRLVDIATSKSLSPLIRNQMFYSEFPNSSILRTAWPLIAKLSRALERKPRRVKVVKGWIARFPSGEWSDVIWRDGQNRGSVYQYFPVTLTIELPNVGKGKAKK